jgi:hypothetical protein
MSTGKIAAVGFAGILALGAHALVTSAPAQEQRVVRRR